MRGRFRSYDLKALHARFMAGEKQADIAKAEGISVTSLRARFTRGYADGTITKQTRYKRNATAYSTICNGFAPIGTIKQVLDGLPPAVGTWMLKEMPEGTSAAEFIQAIIKDAYYEENGE